MTMDMDPHPPGEHPDELLADYVGGSLEAVQRQEVERHLASCDACREDVALARRARAALSSLPELEVPVGVTRPVMEGASRRRPRRSPLGGSPHRSSRVARVTWAVGAAAAVAVVGVFIWGAAHGGTPVKEAAAPSVSSEASRASGGEFTPTVRVTHQSRDYDAASIQALASRVAGSQRGTFPDETVPSGASPTGAAQPAAPLPTPASPETLKSLTAPAPTRLAPLPCVQHALGSSSTVGLLQLIQATFEGRPAYIAVYRQRSGSTHLITVWVVSTSECRLLNYTSTTVQ